MAKRSAPRTEAQDAATAAPPQPRGRRGGSTGAADADFGASEPTQDDIRLRAYQRYLERGGGHGMDFEDWFEAERELKMRG